MCRIRVLTLGTRDSHREKSREDGGTHLRGSDARGGFLHVWNPRFHLNKHTQVIWRKMQKRLRATDARLPT